MNKITRSRLFVRFRCWSRKGYAMFASLGKCVTIGNLRKGVADVSLGKQVQVCTLPSTSILFLEDDSEAIAADDDLNLYDFLLHVSVFQPQQIVEKAGACLRSKYINVKKMRPKRCVMHLFGIFYVFISKDRPC